MKLKKLAAIFLSAVMAVSVTTSAFADTTGPQTGSITVTGVHSGDRHLVAYKLFDATTDGSDHYGYTLNAEYKNALVAAVNAAKPNTIDTTDKTDAQIGSELLNALDGQENDGTFAKDFADSLHNALASSDGNVTLQPGSLEDNKTYTYTATKVPLGYYIVIDKGAGTKEYAPTFAMLSPANTNAQATAKDSNVTSDKTVETDGTFANTGNVNIGDEITYKITGDIPAYASTGNDQYKVKLTDTLSDDLQYTGITSIEFKDKDGKSLHDFAPEADVKFYSGTDQDNQVTPLSEATHFVFDELVVNKTASPKIDYLNDEPATITITYTAKVVSAEQIVDSNTNTFKYEYGNPTNDLKILTNQATVYTYGFNIYKHNNDNQVLAGAVFNLTKKDSTALLTFTKDPNGNYIYDANGNGTLVSGANGYVNIYGLDAGDYVLQETKAPAGYNLLADTIDVKINATRDATTQQLTGEATVSYKPTHGTGDPTDAGDGYTVSVENTTGTQLPGTGGMGTTPFVVGGLLILCAAGAFLFFNRKRVFGK